MKRVVFLTLFAIIIAAGSTMAEAKTAPAAPAIGSRGEYSLQIRQIIRRSVNNRWRRNNRYGRVRYETRIVYKGRKTYRDTYRITWKNGREQVKRISRVRIN